MIETELTATRRRANQRGRSLVVFTVMLALAGATAAGFVHYAGSPAAYRLPGALGGGDVRTSTPAASPSRSAELRRAAPAPIAAVTLPQSPLAAQPFHAVTLPQSSGVSEPSIAVDHHGRVFVTGPATITGHLGSMPSSPVWTSTDSATSFQGPASTATSGTPDGTDLGGGDSDILIDSYDSVFITSLWLGNTSFSVSSDHGTTWTQMPYSHLSPVDDRPWLAYDARDDAMYITWDGADGIHVAKALLRGFAPKGQGAQAASLVFVQDVVAVPEVALGGLPSDAVRQCLCPPGTMAVAADGTVWLAYSWQHGVAVIHSADGISWSAPVSIPDSGIENDPSSVESSFQVLSVDSAGTVYVAWARNVKQADGSQGATQILYSWLSTGATQWHRPVMVSTQQWAVFPAIAVVAPGVIDIAWYGTNSLRGYTTGGHPDPSADSWDLYLAQTRTATAGGPFVVADAYPGVHHGSICLNGTACSSTTDRSLGDFFSIAVDSAGMADIATVADAASHSLVVLHQTGPLRPAPGTATGAAGGGAAGSASAGAGGYGGSAPANPPPTAPAAGSGPVPGGTAAAPGYTTAVAPPASAGTGSVRDGGAANLPVEAFSRGLSAPPGGAVATGALPDPRHGQAAAALAGWQVAILVVAAVAGLAVLLRRRLRGSLG
jgi:hypothetical protein